MRLHLLRFILGALLICCVTVTVSAQDPDVEHYFRVVDNSGQAVQYGYICLTPNGLTQRCAAIDPFGPTTFVLPRAIKEGMVTVYVPGFEHSEDVRLHRGVARYLITIPVG